MKLKHTICAVAAGFIALTVAGCAATGAESADDPGYGVTEEVADTIGETATETTDAEAETETETEAADTATETETTDTVTETEEDAEPQPQTVTYVKVTADGVNVRSGAGTSYSVYGSAGEDTLYSYEGEYDGWYKIGYRNGYAYISKKYAVLTEMAASDNGQIERVIGVGTQLLGTTYVYGAVRYHDGKGNKISGFTVTAFDCSSLMQYMFYMGADVLLDVTTRTQVVQGTTVARSDLQRGDLIFFTNSSRYNKMGVERIGHVALYLGDNYILHTASDYAKIEQISSTRWSYYVQTQRMI